VVPRLDDRGVAGLTPSEFDRHGDDVEPGRALGETERLITAVKRLSVNP
jgi:hypothetical protein